MNLHNLKINKDFVDTIHKQGIGISYGDVLMLRDAWAVNDLQLSSICPHELAVGIPGIAIVDNDDFRNDNPTGAGTSHRTNVMYVQRESLELKHAASDVREKRTHELAGTLNAYATAISQVEPYKTPGRGKTEPSIMKTQHEESCTDIKRIRNVIHTLARVNHITI